MAIGLQGLQIIIVGAISGSSAAGELAAVARWASPVYLIAAAFSAQTFPSMAAATSDAAARRILRPVWRVCGFGVVVSAAIVVAAPQLVNALLGPEYRNSADLLRAMAVATVPVLLNSPLATFLQARSDERAVAVAMTTTVIASLLAIAITATPLGAMAAPVCSGLTQCLLFVVLIRLTSNHSDEFE